MSNKEIEVLSDISNFVGFKSATINDIKDEKIAVVGILAESVPPRRSGCKEGPSAIRKMANNIVMNYYESPSLTVYDIEKEKYLRFKGKEAGVDLGNVEDVFLLSKKVLKDLKHVVTEITDKNVVPIILGGDTRVSEVLLGNKNVYKESTGIIIFSNTVSLPSAVDDCEIDILNLINNVNSQNDEVDILMVGINGYQNKEIIDKFSSLGGDIIVAEDIYNKGTNKTVGLIQEFIDSHNNIICSLDLGVIDMGYAAGTTVDNIGGLTPEHLINITDDIKMGEKLTGVVVSNVAPSHDRRKHTEYLAAHALINLIEDYIFEEVLD